MVATPPTTPPGIGHVAVSGLPGTWYGLWWCIALPACAPFAWNGVCMLLFMAVFIPACAALYGVFPPPPPAPIPAMLMLMLMFVPLFLGVS